MDILTNLWSTWFLGVLFVSWVKCQHQPKDLIELCETKTFRPVCEDDLVILMTHAKYGRMRLGKCVVKDYGDLGCSSDVLEITDTWCSGTTQCEIPVPSPELSETKPCPPDLKPYLEVTYSCIKVLTPDHACAAGKPRHLDPRSGYISSDVLTNQNCGTATSPYRIVTKPGQQIALTLYDFKVSNRHKQPHHNRFTFQPEQQCDTVAEAVEHRNGEKSTTEICRGADREKMALRSSSNKLDIVLRTSGSRAMGQMDYLIYYEVEGCPHLAPIPAAVVTQTGNDITVKCNYTSEIYSLKCQNNEWTGSLKNCSRVARPQNGDLDDSDIPYGISIFIVIIIALVIGLVVLIFGLLFLRRRNHLCGPRFPRSQPGGMVEHIDKDYASYYQTGGGGGTYAHKAPPPGSADLPPCTPLMVPEQIYSQQHQLGGGIGAASSERLACGCPVYMSRDEVLQNHQNSRSVANQCCRQANGSSPDFLSSLSNPDRLTIVGPDMVPINERQIFINNTTTTATSTLPHRNNSNGNGSPDNKRLSHHSTFKPAPHQGQPGADVEINGIIKAKCKDTAVVLGEHRLSQTIAAAAAAVAKGDLATSRVLITHNSSDASEQSDSEAAAFMPRH